MISTIPFTTKGTEMNNKAIKFALLQSGKNYSGLSLTPGMPVLVDPRPHFPNVYFLP